MSVELLRKQLTFCQQLFPNDKICMFNEGLFGRKVRGSVLRPLCFIVIGDCCKITLLLAFSSKILGRWHGHMNGTLLFYQCRLSGGGTLKPYLL